MASIDPEREGVDRAISDANGAHIRVVRAGREEPDNATNRVESKSDGRAEASRDTIFTFDRDIMSSRTILRIHHKLSPHLP